MNSTAHLPPHVVAAFVDRTLGPAERAEVESHLAACEPCRAEVREVGGLLDTAPAGQARPRWLVPLVAAAAAALLVVTATWPRTGHRAPSATGAPATLSPVGSATQLERLTWSSVTGADRYRVALFDDAGRLLWEETLPDTSVAVPAAVAASLGPATHFWSVRARVAHERWTESPLTAFRLEGAPAP